MKKNKTLLLDTNIILRYLLRDNEAQYKVIEKVLQSIRIGERKAIITDGVFAECVYVLGKFYKVPKTEIVAQLEIIFSYSGILDNYNVNLFNALNIFKQNNIDIVDAILLEIADSNNLEMMTFDKGIKRLLK